MSASLVGSEMCIRDRRSPRAQQAKRPSPRLRIGESRRTPMRRSKRRGCLLYTSDAADDISV
eukprot:11600241-Alexandrium_andersonii.AAC.1